MEKKIGSHASLLYTGASLSPCTKKPCPSVANRRSDGGLKVDGVSMFFVVDSENQGEKQVKSFLHCGDKLKCRSV